LDTLAIARTAVFYFTTEFDAVGFKVSLKVVRHRLRFACFFLNGL